MTDRDREQVLMMEPGPAFNTLIAIEVMGWKLVTTRDPTGALKGGEPFKNWVDGNGRGIVEPENFCPSTDIAAAWEVVEKMDEVMWTLTWLTDSRVWQARFIDILPMPEAEAPTTPLAICRAALLVTLADKKSRHDSRSH